MSVRAAGSGRMEYGFMEITSFYFLCFFAAFLLLYYVVPKKWQWGLLLLGSLFYYWFAGSGLLILYPAAAVAVTWCTTALMERAEKAQRTGLKRAALLTEVLLLIGILVVLKYLRFTAQQPDGTLHSLAVPLGISYYTFTLVGYAADVYNGIAERQTNFAKLLLFGMFFPAMLSGPIQTYRETGAELYAPHRLDYNQVTRGLQRMVWGFFKKLVISERAAVLAGTVFDSYAQYPGAYIWFGALMFTIQLYTDFSGCMDIVIGAAEALGIALPENFTQPFFSKTISEYWRRWHITLGVWMRNYVFYPLLRTRLFMSLSSKLRAKYGKKAGKQITTILAMLVLWTSVGLWHGGDIKYVIGCGLLHWFYIVFGELTLPFWKRVLPALHIRMEGRAADLFRIVRTFFLVNIGNVFFNAASAGDAVSMLRLGVSAWNPQILVNGSLTGLGLDWEDLTVFAVSVAVLFLVDLLEVLPDRKGRVLCARDRIAEKKLPVRWLIWISLLFFVIIFGEYGPGYSSAAFIYQGF